MSALVVLFAVIGAAQGQQDPSAECFVNLAKLAPIAAKMSLGAPPKNTFAMLADESFPADAERMLIAEWATAVEKCGELGESYRQNAYPVALLSLVSEAKNVLLGMTIDLYNRKISYGQFNRRRQAMFDEVRARAAEIAEQVREQAQARADSQEQAHRAQMQAEQARQAMEDAQRRQAVLLLLNQMRANQPRAMVPYQMPLPATRTPRTTTCMWMGDMLRCSTQ